MPIPMAALTGDLAAETQVLDDLLGPLAPAGWDTPTPAQGWAIRDQVGHLAYFDEAATRSVTDPNEFVREAERVVADHGANFPDAIAEQYRGMPVGELLGWFRGARRAYLATLGPLDPGTRLPWYGPAMSAASSVTARLMETWAHGQDVADALGVTREPTARLRHVAHLGVRTAGWSFAVRERPVPATPVRVELAAPDGSTWTWGPDGVADAVRGPALDFCLLVTQRRHRDDLAVVATGATATEWLSLAQAFAGAPGAGRGRLGSGW